MKLTDELKQKIDNMSYADMLAKWRFAPIGDNLFQDDSGKYFSDRMFALRDAKPEAAVAASKAIGWGS